MSPMPLPYQDVCLVVVNRFEGELLDVSIMQEETGAWRESMRLLVRIGSQGDDAALGRAVRLAVTS